MTASYLAQEAIKPQFDRSFQKDLINALEDICEAIKHRMHGSSEHETFVDVWKRLKNPERDKILAPLKTVIANHTGLPIKAIKGSVKTIGTSTILCPLYFGQTKQFGTFERAVKNKNYSLETRRRLIENYINSLRLAGHVNKETGKIKSKPNPALDYIIELNLNNLYKSSGSRKALEETASVILHECGHLYDHLESSDRKITYSLITDSILEENRKSENISEVITTLSYYWEMYNYLKLKNIFVSEVKSDIETLLKIDQSDEHLDKKEVIEDANVFITLICNAVNQYVGKTDDFSRTDSHYKNSERKADIYATRQGGGAAFADHLARDYDLITDLTWLSRFTDDGQFKRNTLLFGYGYSEKSAYDSLYRRVERILQEYYKMSRDVFDQDKDVKRDIIKTIETLRKTVKRLEMVKDEIAPDSGFFHRLKLGIKRLFKDDRTRRAQDTHIENALQNTVSIPLYHEANRLMYRS